MHILVLVVQIEYYVRAKDRYTVATGSIQKEKNKLQINDYHSNSATSKLSTPGVSFNLFSRMCGERDTIHVVVPKSPPMPKVWSFQLPKEISRSGTQINKNK